jgi:hypothetical protein
MQFDTKVAIVLDEQLAGWQKANVTAFFRASPSTRTERPSTRCSTSFAPTPKPHP